MAPLIMPLTIDPTERDAMMVTPKMATQKISAGPNFNEIWARGGEKINKATMPTIPPISDAVVA